MKNIFLTLIICATTAIFTFWSCESAQNELNPNMPEGKTNPEFTTDITGDTLRTKKEGGTFTVNVRQSSAYRWTAESNATWATLDVAPTDTVEGNRALTLTVKSTTDRRTAKITLKEVSPKVNRTLALTIVQTQE